MFQTYNQAGSNYVCTTCASCITMLDCAWGVQKEHEWWGRWTWALSCKDWHLAVFKDPSCYLQHVHKISDRDLNQYYMKSCNEFLVRLLSWVHVDLRNSDVKLLSLIHTGLGSSFAQQTWAESSRPMRSHMHLIIACMGLMRSYCHHAIWCHMDHSKAFSV